jgi:hypothetical protein
MKNKHFRKDMIVTDFRNSFNKVMETTNWKQVDYYDVLRPYLKGLKKLYIKLSQSDGDYRNGEETYKYTSDEDIRNHLAYISDRWYSAFRVKWLIDLIEDDPLNGFNCPTITSKPGFFNGVAIPVSWFDLPEENVIDSIKEVDKKYHEPMTVSYSTINSPVNEYYVSEDGDDSNDGLTPEKPLKTVQQALEGKDNA